MFKKTPEEKVKKFGNAVGELLRVEDIVGFFLYDNNPSYQDAKIEHAIARDRAGLKSINWNIVIVMGILLMFGAIAYQMVSGTFTQNTCQTQLAECILSQNTTNTYRPAPPTQEVPIETPSSPGIIIK